MITNQRACTSVLHSALPQHPAAGWVCKPRRIRRTGKSVGPDDLARLTFCGTFRALTSASRRDLRAARHVRGPWFRRGKLHTVTSEPGTTPRLSTPALASASSARPQRRLNVSSWGLPDSEESSVGCRPLPDPGVHWAEVSWVQIQGPGSSVASGRAGVIDSLPCLERPSMERGRQVWLGNTGDPRAVPGARRASAPRGGDPPVPGTVSARSTVFQTQKATAASSGESGRPAADSVSSLTS